MGCFQNFINVSHKTVSQTSVVLLSENEHRKQNVWHACLIICYTFLDIYKLSCIDWPEKKSYLCKSLSRFLFGYKTLGNIFLEWWEEDPEQGDVLPEQACGGDAAWVKRSKRDTGFLVVAPVEFLHSEHVADLAVFICLGTIEFSTVDHGWSV